MISTAPARQMFQRCSRAGLHDEGDLDPRIVAFYEQLRSDFPDHPPHDRDSPWMVMPLAEQYRLVLYDPQSDDAHLPAT